MDEREIYRVVEALLLVADKPLTVEQVQEVVEAEPRYIHQAFDALKRECDERERGFRVKELAGGYQLITDPALAETVRTFIREKEKKRLSQASLETLSIIAYRQPITKPEIEYIRGVNIDTSLKTLLEKGLVRITGRKDAAGRPMLYSTTKEFLDHFGLGSLKELPKLADFCEKDIELPHGGRQEEMPKPAGSERLTAQGGTE